MNEIINPDDEYRLRYLTFLHNINSLFSMRDIDQNEIYKQIIKTKQKQLEFVYQRDALNNVKLIGKENICNNCIFAAFHLGNYRLISRYFVDNNIKHTIVMNIKNKKEESSFKERLSRANQGEEKCNYVNISHRNGILSLRDSIKQKRAILIYIDANLSNNGYKNVKKENIKFMGHEIKVMKGVAYLSKKFKIPIVPVISYTNKDNNYIVIMKKLNQQLSINETMQNLWNFLEKYLQQYPYQWEGWLFAENLDISKTDISQNNAVGNNFIFNSKEYYFINHAPNNHSVYSVHTGYLIALQKEIYNLLLNINEQKLIIENKILKKVFGEINFMSLLKNRIFICNNTK